MNKLVLQHRRTREIGAATLGWIDLGDGASVRTLELPWRDNERGASRIPPGLRQITPKTDGRYRRAYVRRWGHAFSLEIARVEGRTAILLHTGNYPCHTRGCVLVGTDAVEDPRQPRLLGSRPAYRRLYEAIGFDADPRREVWINTQDRLGVQGESDELDDPREDIVADSG